MVPYLALAFVALVVAYSAYLYRWFLINLEAAKKSGLPYVCAPVYTFNKVWLSTHVIILPVLRALLPRSWMTWADFAVPDWGWLHKHGVYERLGVDALIVVSPEKNLVAIADADACSQITTRRADFPKPIDIYRSLDVFGKNVVSTEGSTWRHHRKITSPPFTERNNRVVWQESLHQAKALMSGWIGAEEEYSKPVFDVSDQTMRLSLHVISRAGFDVRLTWPHEEGTTQEIPEGHTLSFKDALTTLLDNLLVVLIFPMWIMKWAPNKLLNETHEAYTEWFQYMREMYHNKLDEVKNGEAGDGMDLMGALVKGAGVTAESDSPPTSPGETKKSSGTPSRGKTTLTEEEVYGNAFVFILAGHETAANTIHFATLFLAMHPSSLFRLQQDLDAQFGDRPSDTWDYDEDLPKLFGNMCGAVMNEELRVLPPVVGIPKSTPANQPQGLNINGQHHTIPQDSFMSLSTAGLHRNPKYWPHTSIKDLNEFRPERWLLDDNASKAQQQEAAAAKPEDGPEADSRNDTSSSLYRPPKGSFVPFSDGYRSCIGKRFAQIEILAVLAVMFKTWSVELDVSMFLKEDETEDSLSDERKKEVWKLADERTRDLIQNGLGTIVTIQMRKGKVPVRFVKRGSERFAHVTGK